MASSEIEAWFCPRCNVEYGVIRGESERCPKCLIEGRKRERPAPRPPRAWAMTLVVVAALAGVGWFVSEQLARLRAPMGSHCASASDCRGRVCLTDIFGGSGKCSQDCETDACPAGTLCASVAGGRYCVPKPTKTLGDACVDGTECRGGHCVSPFGLGGGYCTRDCTQESDCGSRFACGEVSGDRVCVKRDWCWGHASSCPASSSGACPGPSADPRPGALRHSWNSRMASKGGFRTAGPTDGSKGVETGAPSVSTSSPQRNTDRPWKRAWPCPTMPPTGS